MAVLTVYIKLLLILSVIKKIEGFNATSGCVPDLLNKTAGINGTQKCGGVNITMKDNTKPKITCDDIFTDINDTATINLTEYCHGAICIPKCCKYNDHLYFKSIKFQCNSTKEIENATGIPVNLPKIDIYENNIKENIQKIDSKRIRSFRNYKMKKGVCNTAYIDSQFNIYILENSSLVLEKPNHLARFVNSIDIKDYCVEHIVQVKDGKVLPPTLMIKLFEDKTNNNMKNKNNNQEEKTDYHLYYTSVMLVSCFFLVFVLFVYGAIRELRNLVGLILMAYVATLTLCFLIKVILALSHPTTDTCKPTSVILYYLILSNFFWMNIMSLDIWWTFRGIFKSRPIHRRGELTKFAWYGMYSWGLPLLITIPVAILDYIDMSRWPHIFIPHFQNCLLIADGQLEIKYYLQMPCLALILLNWVFFLMTTFNIWRIRRNMAQFSNETDKYNNNKNRFGLYLKLSLVMGVSWVLETYNDLPKWLEFIANSYNSLVGVAIFLIFVCKRKIFLMLCKRFSVRGQFVENLQRQYSKGSTMTGSNSDRKRSAVELEVTTSNTNGD